ncbi:hypothetical protein GCM10009645_34370 [Mycolicibacterium poriferae]|uniref:Uncharacterized protein n=1 Tax=Mycolicibacterium poriferae TaxID=39694 RepID=A0A6N4VJ44_9MYCO|nr:hypothetical protein MPOR_56500 [Mycolicibacterium poriferae]
MLVGGDGVDGGALIVAKGQQQLPAGSGEWLSRIRAYPARIRKKATAAVTCDKN